MEFQKRAQDGFVVIDLIEGRFEYPKTLLLKQQVLQWVEDGHHHMVLNLKGVDFLDSFGLAVIISLLKAIKTKGGTLILCGLTESVQRLVELTKMDQVLDIWLTEGQAVYRMQEILGRKQKQPGVSESTA
jgi:anti-anti-sigma factor